MTPVDPATAAAQTVTAYQFFKDFAGPLSTAMAAVAAALVTGLFAYRQAKTAELQAEIALDKLKYETFEKRYDVLDACRELYSYCNTCVNRQVIIDATVVADHASRINMGKFYFGRQVCRMLNAYIRAARVLRVAQWELRRLDHDVVVPDDTLSLRDAAHEAFDRSASFVDELLEYDLSLNLLKRGSDQRHGLPERLRRVRRRRMFYKKVWARLRRPIVQRRATSDLPPSGPPQV